MFHKSLLLTGLAVLPTLSSVPVNVNTSQEVQVEENESEQEESCTFMYVGKNVSDNGKALVARCGDSSPASMNMHAQIFAHNQLANVTVKGSKGFSWKMPSTTYKYMATPRNPVIKNGLHWEVSAINEKGVAVSATLTCNTNDTALKFDKWVDNGITEDNIAQIVGATADTAKNGILTIANIIDTIGNKEPNAIMIMDKDEVWYMEMYTGHQYLAIKMPDDKACTIGNEFMLNTIDELKTTYKIKDDDIIKSDNLYKLPVDNGFVEYDTSGTKDIDHMHLYNTYAGHTIEKVVYKGNFINSCHMRTWRGRDLFADDSEKAKYTIDGTTYRPTTKYTPFWTPSRNLTVNDVITFMRDRFETISDADDKAAFATVLEKEGRLRVVGTGNTYQVHVMYVDPELPTEISVTEWMALSSANYTPFVPFNNGIDRLIDRYTYVSPYYGVDENAACCIYKKLNNLANTDRTNLGLPVQEYITTHEGYWQTQYNKLITDIKPLALNQQKDILTNFSCWLQMLGLEMSKMLYDDVMCRIANPPSPTKDQKFQPLICPEYYGYIFGWDCSTNNNIVTMKQKNEVLTFDCNYTEKPETGWISGKLSLNGEVVNSNVRARVKDGVCFMDQVVALKYISGDHTLRDLDYKDFISVSNNNSSWVIPVAITVPIVVLAASVAPVMAFTSSKKKKLQIKK